MRCDAPLSGVCTRGTAVSPGNGSNGMHSHGYPNLFAMAGLAASGAEVLDFEFGLDLMLDGLERLLPAG